MNCANTSKPIKSETQTRLWELPIRFEGRSAMDHDIILTLQSDSLFFLWMGPEPDSTSKVQNRVMPLTYSDMGRFRIDSTKHHLILDGNAESDHRWLIRDPDSLIRLNNVGQIIRPQNPTLITPTANFSFMEKPVSMVGDFRYYADSPSFTERKTQTRWPVWMDSTYLNVERYYLNHRKEPGAPLPLRIKGHLEMKPAMEGDNKIPYLIIDQMVGWLD